MTHRPRSHEIGSSAVHSVTREWIMNGAAVEEVRNDYGEDLLVQTSLNGVVDESKIWVQVKGKERVAISQKTGNPSAVQVSRLHAERWSKTTDLVLVVMWDVSRDIGWYAIPALQFDTSTLSLSSNKYASIKFDKKRVFNSRSASELSWLSRTLHAQRLAQSAYQDLLIASHLEESAARTRAESSLDLTALTFAEKAGMICAGGPSRDFTYATLAVIEFHEREFPDVDRESLFTRAIGGAIVTFMWVKCRVEVPDILLYATSKVVESICRDRMVSELIPYMTPPPPVDEPSDLYWW